MRPSISQMPYSERPSVVTRIGVITSCTPAFTEYSSSEATAVSDARLVSACDLGFAATEGAASVTGGTTLAGGIGSALVPIAPLQERGHQPVCGLALGAAIGPQRVDDQMTGTRDLGDHTVERFAESGGEAVDLVVGAVLDEVIFLARADPLRERRVGRVNEDDDVEQ